MPGPSSGPTYKTVLNELAASLSGPISQEDLIQQVLARKPSAAKNPKQNVRNNLRSLYPLPFIYLDPQTLLPTRLALQGARFRLPFGRHAAESGQIEMAWFASYLPQHFDLQKVQFVDARGQAIPAPRRSLSKKINTPLGTYEQPIMLTDLSAWLRPQNVTRHDDLLVTVLDWQNGLLQLQVEPRKRRDPALIQARDRLLADLLYAILESAHHERVWIHEALPTAYARLPEKESCPPHHWKIVLGQDNRFRFDDYEIQYADGRLSPLEYLLQEHFGQPPRRQRPVTKEQKKLVYRFKAAFEHNPRIWRQVEILGEQTLADLNSILIDAFDHELDHMAGFWKLVPRHGTKTRYRKVELGKVDPFGEGDGADVQIAAIGLKEGERLKYVFDFGDWIEHILKLEAVCPAEEGVKYPRETARNQPRYLYCVECQANGKETIARWCCLTCSGEQDLYCCCDDCIAKHDDHYIEKIVY